MKSIFCWASAGAAASTAAAAPARMAMRRGSSMSSPEWSFCGARSSLATALPRQESIDPETRDLSFRADRRDMTSLDDRTTRTLTAVASHLALLVVWYLFVKFGNVPKFVMPSPDDTVKTLFAGNYSWWTNTAVTAAEIFGGYVLALLVGVLLALAFTWSKPLEAAMMPLLVSLNMIPKVALGPLIIVWFKYGIVPNMLIAFSICVFPILLTTVRGLREVEPDLARSRADAARLALAGLHQDPAPRRAAVHLLGDEGRRDPRRRRRDRRRVPRLRQRGSATSCCRCR
jgi:hypothetical protein